MQTKTSAVPKPIEKERVDPAPLREEMRPARGLLVGLAFSVVFWLGLLVLWLSF